MNISAGSHSPATLRRRRTGNRPSACSRHRKHGGQVGRLAGLSTTPHSHWKFNAAAQSPELGKVRRSGEDGGLGIGAGTVSSRKLAASLWRFRLVDGGGGSQCGSRDRIKFHSHCTGEKDGLSTSFASPSKNAIPHKALPDPSRGSAISSNEPHRFNNGVVKFPDNRQVDTVSELAQARLRIHELEAEKRSFHKKTEHLLQKVKEEKSSWKRREHEKIRLNDQLTRERESRQRLEKLNSTLVSELANAKVSAKKLIKDYNEEKRARELMEEMCNDLAKEIGQDRAEMAAWKNETSRFQEDLEEERKMLQMAEAWREERIQMKLVDAKLALEDKFRQMNNLIKELEFFLHTRNESLGAMELRNAQLMKKAARSVKITDIDGFSYLPSKPGDIFSVIEELQQAEVTKTGNGLHEQDGVIKTFRYTETDISEVCSVSKRNTTPTSKHWNEEICQTVSDETGDSHITQELKKCVEWPRGIHRNSLQARLLEARMES